ncbi:MAG: translation initiation factor IF-2 [Clostridia bacterium]|nr:translation initiation factor IF-2 [Clostridia bacterium]
MTNVKSKGATKELAVEAQKVLGDATRVRKGADSLVQSLKKLENRFQREKEEAAAQLRREEQQKAIASHSKAFTMLDDEDKAQIAAAEAAEKAAKEAAAKAAAEKAAAEAAAAKAAQEKAAAEAAAAKAAEEKAKAAAAKAAEPKKPAIGQIISRPGQQPQPQKPVGLAPNVIRAPQPARPVQQGQQGARPAGPYGRPANPQGPYGRPANPQGPYGRPANPQGPYGRPANPQGPYGRPANPQGQQGQFARPAQGGAARPQGQFGRPAGAPGQGGFGQRPAPGGAPRPGMGGGRPQGGMSRSKAPELAPPMEKERVSNYDPNKKNYVRQHDPERVTRNRKQEARNNFNGYDDDVIRGGKRSRVKKPSAQQMMAPIKIETAYMAGDTIVVRDLCEKIGKTSGEIIKKLFLLGNMATINSEIDFDTAQLVCSDFDITLERKAEQTAEDALVAEDFTDTEENLLPRPPVVTIMGHVDHGKTSLLDYIRSSRVTAGEAGGITQHIGAYTVDVDGQAITFLDTPGHEAFTAMRARGTQATDIAVLVVAADDSVMPQTVESINHAKAAEVPVIVAINKMDKPTANPDRVKQDLTNYGIVCEDWGGDTICVPVSALTGDGVDELLEMILMQAEMLELRANPNRLAKGVIVEAKLDKARGPLATVLLQNGTLHVGDNIVAGLAAGRVRALINDRGEKVQSAGPSMPVEIMGFDEVPSAGDEMIAVGDDHLSRKVADERREKLRASREATAAKMSMENLFSSLEEGKTVTLNLIIKADVQGSVEAVKQAMLKLTSDEVKVRVLHSGAGAVTKDDVNLASAFNAIIIGFNVRPDASAREAAEKEKVDVRLYTIIYKAIEDMEKAMKGLLEPEYKEVLLGHAEVRNVFKITGAGIIAGCYVQDGKVQRNAQVRLLRDNVVVFEGKLSSLRHLKEDVKEMKEGFECGMSLEGHNDIKEGDIVECFIMEEIPR